MIHSDTSGASPAAAKGSQHLRWQSPRGFRRSQSPSGPRGKVRLALTRAEKWLLNPISAYFRVSEKLFGKPVVRDL